MLTDDMIQMYEIELKFHANIVVIYLFFSLKWFYCFLAKY